jgi:ribosomal protein S18 acetylase RimI-like enzyme
MSVSIETLDYRHASSPLLPEILGQEYLQVVENLKVQQLNGGFSWAILLSGQSVGMIAIMADLEMMIAVHPAFQRRGIATAAITLAIANLRANNITTIRARTRIGAGSNALIRNFSAVETARTTGEIFYEIKL